MKGGLVLVYFVLVIEASHSFLQRPGKRSVTKKGIVNINDDSVIRTYIVRKNVWTKPVQGIMVPVDDEMDEDTDKEVRTIMPIDVYADNYQFDIGNRNSVIPVVAGSNRRQMTNGKRQIRKYIRGFSAKSKNKKTSVPKLDGRLRNPQLSLKHKSEHLVQKKINLQSERPIKKKTQEFIEKKKNHFSKIITAKGNKMYLVKDKQFHKDTDTKYELLTIRNTNNNAFYGADQQVNDRRSEKHTKKVNEHMKHLQAELADDSVQTDFTNNINNENKFISDVI